ncbi:MAG: hypothetical protein II673_00350, partial [Ruminococcus sp.]|nr:hypothetical protein [Ruminococcus sp.]
MGFLPFFLKRISPQFGDNEVKIKKIEDLANYSLILPKKESSVKKIFNEKYGNLFKEPHFEISQEILKKELIMENLGIAFIAKDEIKDELKSGKIIQVNLDDA